MTDPRTLALLCALTPLAACVETGPTATSWGGASYFVQPIGYTRVSAVGGALASVATYNGVTSVSTSAGANTGASLVTDGKVTTVTSSSGGAEAALGTSGSLTAISTSTSGASAAIASDGTTSSGATQAGTATSSW